MCHGWLRALHPVYGACLTSDDYTAAVRIRLGAPDIADDMSCPRCHARLDRRCAHGETCAKGECTKGHAHLRNAVLQLASLGDPEASAEPVGLIPSRPMLRPGDILNSAAGGGLVALGVGVCAPGAVGVGLACCESMRVRMIAEYHAHTGVLEAQGIRYQLL